MALYATTKLLDESPKGTIHLMNVSIEDFHTKYLDDDNKEISITIPSLQSKEFPHTLGLVIRNHLANFILEKQGFSYKTDVNIELNKIKERITIYE